MGGATTTCVTHSETDDFNHEKLDSVPQSSCSLFSYLSVMLSALPLMETRAKGYLLIVEKNLGAFEDRLPSFLQGKRGKIEASSTTL